MFRGWEKVTIRDDQGVPRDAVAPVIVSASRSTDIPAFYGDWLIQRLSRGHAAWVNPWNGALTYVSFARTRAIVFWSKNPLPFLGQIPALEEMGYSFYFLYTLNDYESEGLEPGVPDLDSRVRTFSHLASLVGPDRVVWRCDPLLLSDSLRVDDLLSRVEAIGKRIHRNTRRLVISFVDIGRYPRVRHRLDATGHGDVREFSGEEIGEFCRGLAEINRDWGLFLSACGEPADLSPFGIARGECINAGLMREVFSTDAALMEFLSPAEGWSRAGKGRFSHPLKDPGQRKECGCIASKDIGRYSTCPHLCTYCYANTSRETVEKNWLQTRQALASGHVPEWIGGP
ncbi:MAG: DUF1848 domain-containing protein [Methanolinea sp.]|nr:DUF1848 domain-containing protein [Methanolinea sp.]